MKANELMRPEWCPDHTCICIDSYGNVLCVGRKKKMTHHEDLYNTHNYCEASYDVSGEQLEPDKYDINYADALYTWKLMAKVIKDIDDNSLYKPTQDGRKM